MKHEWKWWIASLLVHASLVSVAASAVPVPRAESPRGVFVAFELPPERHDDLSAVTGHRVFAAMQSQVRPGGEQSAQNVSDVNRGERGDGRSLEAARMMAARADSVNLDPRLMNTRTHAQEQRIRTARVRSSPQDDRRTPNPDDDPWTTTGHGVILVRTRSAQVTPAEGVVHAATVATRAGDDAATRMTRTTQRPSVAVERLHAPGGTERRATGIVHAQGRAATTAASLATQRPSIEAGHASTTADRVTERPNDDTDAALLATALQRAHVSASLQEGPRRADGVGGVGGGDAPGSGGGFGRGGAARAYGNGDGRLSLDTRDARYVRYFAQLRRRIYQATERAFPHDAALQLRQGTVIVHFSLARDGTVSDVTVQRPSGIDAYDHNVREALARLRMPPIPASLGNDRLVIRAPVAFVSPVVR